MSTIHTTVGDGREGAVGVALVEGVGVACVLPWKDECLLSWGAAGEATGFVGRPWNEVFLLVLYGVVLVAGCTGAVPGEKELFPYGGAL